MSIFKSIGDKIFGSDEEYVKYEKQRSGKKENTQLLEKERIVSVTTLYSSVVNSKGEINIEASCKNFNIYNLEETDKKILVLISKYANSKNPTEEIINKLRENESNYIKLFIKMKELFEDDGFIPSVDYAYLELKKDL